MGQVMNGSMGPSIDDAMDVNAALQISRAVSEAMAENIADVICEGNALDPDMANLEAARLRIAIDRDRACFDVGRAVAIALDGYGRARNDAKRQFIQEQENSILVPKKVVSIYPNQ